MIRLIVCFLLSFLIGCGETDFAGQGLAGGASASSAAETGHSGQAPASASEAAGDSSVGEANVDAGMSASGAEKCLALAGEENGQTATLAPGVEIADDFADVYSAYDLGKIQGLREQKYGGLVVKRGNPNRLLIAAWEDNAIYEVSIKRNAEGHIVGFGDDIHLFAETSCGIDGGLAFAEDGNLHGVGFPCGQHYVLTPEGDQVAEADVSTLDKDPQTNGGAVNFVPEWHRRAGEMRFVSWPNGNWYDTFGDEQEGQPLSGGVEGFAWVPASSPGFAKQSVIMSEWRDNMISIYQTDANANPVAGTRLTFATGVTGAEGAFFDPHSGDFLFSTWGDQNRILVIRGFASTLAKDPCD